MEAGSVVKLPMHSAGEDSGNSEEESLEKVVGEEETPVMLEEEVEMLFLLFFRCYFFNVSNFGLIRFR